MLRTTITFFALFLSFSLLQAQAYQDCAAAKEVCKKQSYRFDKVGGEGADTREADLIACFMNGANAGQAEENSTWIKFEVKSSGTLTFTITPLVSTHDYDFIVFKLPPDGNCAYKQIVRCMASGPTYRTERDGPCMGPTGLREGETDTSEDAGCSDPDDNAWLAPLRVKAGERYVILASNVTESGPGFTLNFGGSCQLGCEEKPVVAERPKPKPKVTPPPVPEKPAEKPVAEKPAPAKEPEVVVEVPPTPKKEKTDVLEGRKTTVKEEVKVKKREIILTLRDNQVEDGDVVSVFVDDQKVLRDIALKTTARQFKLTLPQGKNEFQITVFAESFGRREPNTATVTIFDGVNTQKIDLEAGRKAQESVKVIVE